ncbi:MULTISPECIES: DNA internalization-related competence protein ComEC/Rec2 [unclassified Halanaerobium]|uniref:DNA internalization-related competence protein ComEC/Rec2 n=1 Tax=unclassified Halanaerobium TaxID=2641197 RepID=UPI000DF49BB1|nr:MULTISPECIES: DNA internalization-related competence protein ComEC/Rec2 [unclassified Halanaerobium]RCW45408.1 competence protein ComEC [Halanaerobium sp. MA284_MarDTE_T2]RCW82586.1 competence protein ComEC [Halanaerobium sp. DL-01]
MKRRPCFYISAALLAGILLARIYLEFFNRAKILFLLISLVYLIYSTVADKKQLGRKYFNIMLIFLLIGFTFFIYENYKYTSSFSITNYADNKSHSILASLKIPISNLEGKYYYFKPKLIDGRKVKYGLLKVPKKKLIKFKDNDLIKFKAVLSLLEEQKNPGGFSYRKYMKKKGVFAETWQLKNVKFIENGFSLLKPLIRLKKKLINILKKLFSKDKHSFLLAVLLGEKEHLSFEQKELLQSTGAGHLLAISGLHIGIIILFLSKICFKIFFSRRLSLYFITFFTINYLVITGGSVSVIRASVLALLYLWSDEFNREGDFLNLLGVTMIINLLVSPASLFTVSLQLSYVLVTSLVILSEFLRAFNTAAVFKASAAAQLASFPLTAYYFNKYCYIAFLTNIWLIPFVGLLLPLSFFLMIVSFFSLTAANFLVPPVNLGIDFLFFLLKIMDLLQKKILIIATPNLFIVLIYYVVLFCLPYIYKKRIIPLKRKQFGRAKIILPLIFIMILISFFVNPDFNKNLEVVFLSVGQGDGIFIKFPDGRNMLVDTGPPGADGRNANYNIIPFLNYRGIDKIDYLLITHFDSDHAGGAEFIIARKEVEAILIPSSLEKNKYYNSISQNHSKIFKLSEVNSFQIGEVYIDFLNPSQQNFTDDKNDNSLAFLMQYGDTKMFLTGDLSVKGEKRILNENKLGKINILKAGHHGSSTSTSAELLDYTEPDLVVISVGKNNYGHPSKEVIQKLRKRQIPYLRTDKNGAVMLKSSKKQIYVDTFN